ncbi:mu-like prophage tail protein gpP [Caudoviricetes sp.]|nr:mu-like prophage tail protein gpP [Caudoviricetes sp.]
MAGLPESGLTARFNLLGRTEEKFKAWTIDSAYLVSTDGFSFDLLSDNPQRDCVELLLQPVELLVGGASQLLGRVDKTRVGHDGRTITCEGRDYLSDLVECNADPNLNFGPDTDLADLILQAASPCGIFEITDFENILMAEVRSGKSIARKTRKRRKRKLQSYKPKPGEGIYEFINRPVARQGATIQPGPDRNSLVIDSPEYGQEPLFNFRRTDDITNSGANNIVEGTAERDYSRFPTYTLFTGTASSLEPGKQTTGIKALYPMLELAKAFNSEMAQVIKQATKPDRATSVDPGFPALLYRLLYHRDQEARSQEDLEVGARRAIAERVKDTLAYACSVMGHAHPVTGAVISVNTMANVDDAICAVHEPLWIARRTLRYQDGAGAMTDVELWRPESFQISDEE